MRSRSVAQGVTALPMRAPALRKAVARTRIVLTSVFAAVGRGMRRWQLRWLLIEMDRHPSLLDVPDIRRWADDVRAELNAARRARRSNKQRHQIFGKRS